MRFRFLFFSALLSLQQVLACTKGSIALEPKDSGAGGSEGAGGTDTSLDANKPVEVPQMPPNCGDGILQQEEGETCEDMNSDNGDGCSNFCHREYFGRAWDKGERKLQLTLSNWGVRVSTACEDEIPECSTEGTVWQLSFAIQREKLEFSHIYSLENLDSYLSYGQARNEETCSSLSGGPIPGQVELFDDDQNGNPDRVTLSGVAIQATPNKDSFEMNMENALIVTCIETVVNK